MNILYYILSQQSLSSLKSIVSSSTPKDLLIFLVSIELPKMKAERKIDPMDFGHETIEDLRLDIIDSIHTDIDITEQDIKTVALEFIKQLQSKPNIEIDTYFRESTKTCIKDMLSLPLASRAAGGRRG